MSAADLWTVDLGNTRASVRAWSAGAGPELLGGLDLASDGDLVEALERRLDELPLAPRAALSAVASAELERRLGELLRGRLGAGYLGVPPHGLVIGARDEPTIGLDRLFAARWAQRLAGPTLVVDAGTALTVDAVAERDGRPLFLGGAIAPGPGLLARALASGAARLPLIDPAPGAPALGRDTREALEAGVVVGFRGAARELVARVAAESGLAADRLVLGGGARRFLTEPPLWPRARVLEVADLVHLGLWAAATEPS
jgi:type III pantothenate kinase